VLKVLTGYAISQRRACVLIGVDPKTVRLERPPDHGAIRTAMRKVAGQRRRFGYRRIGHHAGPQGNDHEPHEDIPALPGETIVGSPPSWPSRRPAKLKRALSSRTPMPAPLVPGARWSMDFPSDTFGSSRKFRILAGNDDCYRENLCLVGDTSI